MAPPAAAQEFPHPCDAEVCRTTIDVTVTPTGTWGEDGFLDDQDEIATFDVDAHIVFEEPVAACAEANDVLFQMQTTEFARANITPSRHTIDIPVGGGAVHVQSELTLWLLRGTPPLATEGIILRTIMQSCPLQPQERAETSVTVAVQSEIRPWMEVEFEQPDALTGHFRLGVFNGGNANLLVSAEVRPHNGSPPQNIVPPAPTRVDVGDIRDFVFDMPDNLPGNYTVTLEGRWSGDPDNASLPHAVYHQNVSIQAAPAPPATGEGSPGVPLVPLLAAAFGLAVGLRRQRQKS